MALTESEVLPNRRQTKLKLLVGEFAYAYPQHTSILRGHGHGARDVSHAAIGDLLEEIEQVGGQEILKRIDDAIRYEPGRDPSVSALHQRLQELKNSL